MRSKLARNLALLACLATFIAPIIGNNLASAAPISYSLFSDYTHSSTPVFDNPLELGVSAVSSQAGYITAVRFYQYWDGTNGNTGPHVAHVWSGSTEAPGALLATKSFPSSTESPTATGWVEVALDSPIYKGANETFTVSVSSTNGFYTRDGVPDGKRVGPLTFVGTSYRYFSNGVFPDTNSGTNYGTDFTFVSDIAKITLDAGDTRSYPGSGNTVTDLVSGITGTMTNISYDANACGALVFNGNGRIRFPSADFGNYFTMSAWVKPTSANTNIQTLFANAGNGGGSNGFKVFWSGNRIVLENGNGGAASQPATGAVMVSGEWQQIAVTFNKVSRAVTIYRNGVLLTTSNTGMLTNANTNGTWWMGEMNGGNYTMTAQIGVLKVYSAVLGQSQITDDYNSTSGRYSGTPICPAQPPVNSVAPTFSGSAQFDGVLTATSGTWSHSPTLEYQWQRSSTVDGVYSNIVGATSSTYTVTRNEVGKFVRINVRGSNVAGFAESASSASTEVQGLLPAAPTLNSVTGGDRSLSLVFTQNGDGGSAITGYQYSLNGETFTAISSTTLPLLITPIAGRETFTVTIKAVNAIGVSGASESLTARTTDGLLDASEAATAEAARLAALAAEAARLAAIAEAERVAEAERIARTAEEARLQELERQRLIAEAIKAEEERIAAELKAKEEAVAKLAAELKAKEEAEKKALVEKEAAELKAKEEAEKKKLADEKKAADLKAAEAKAKAEAKAEEEKKAAEAKVKAEEERKVEAERRAKAEEARQQEAARSAAPTTVATVEVITSNQATAEIVGSSESPNATVETTQLEGKYVSSALSAGGNKVALKLTGLKVGTKIILTLKRSVR